MRRSSWIILGVCLVLAAVLAFAYIGARAPARPLGQDDAVRLLRQMQDGVAHKNVGEIMSQISSDPDARLANLNSDQLRLMLARAFRNTGHLHADVSNVSFQGNESQGSLDFDLSVTQQTNEMSSNDYKGHITLHLKAAEEPHWLGLYHTKEWKVTGAETTGPDPANFGDY